MEGLRDALISVPVLDVHSHLIGGKLCAGGLHDVLLYHMVVTELYAAGCPTGRRLTEYPGSPSDQEAAERIEEAIPFLARIANTSTFWGVRTILKDLYGWTEAITRDNWRRLDALIRERRDDRSWQRGILDRANIKRTCTELARRDGGGADDDCLQYSLEWAFFTRLQWGEYDTAVYELEKCWGKTPSSPTPILPAGAARPQAERQIRSIADVHAAIEHYVNAIPYDRVISTATGISGEIDYRIVSDAEMESALLRRDRAGEKERDVYASFIQEAFLTALERKAGGRCVFQMAIAFEPMPFETCSRISQRFIGQVAEIVARHPKLHFQVFLASRHANQSLCTLCRELPNLSMAGYWWHNFFPDTIRQVMNERLDMLPLNKQVGFFSDAYCVEWSYAKLAIVKRQMAEVLAAKVEQGQYSRDVALSIARTILYETPQELLRMVPRDDARRTGER
jgi:hypothetical protein